MAKHVSTPSDIIDYKGVPCRRAYARALIMANEEGYTCHLDSGFRSVAKQWKLWWLYKAGKGALAAFPGTSTHNKRNYRQGLDINSLDNGTGRFQRWARKHGMTFNLTVRGEAWHLNAAENYDHHIYVLWHRRLERIAAKQREDRARLEADRKRKKKHG